MTGSSGVDTARAKPDPTIRALSTGQILLILAVGLAFSIETAFHLLPLNPFVHYRDVSILRTCAAFFIPFLAIWWALRNIERGSAPRMLLLALLVASNFVLQLAGLVIDPRGPRLIKAIILSPTATSYFNDALRIDALSINGLIGWLSDYHQADLILHGQSHPPGPIVFCWLCIKLFRPSAAVWVCAFAMAFAGALGVALVYPFASIWTEDSRARLCASAFYALTPVLIVFFPEFDQMYPAMAMLLVLFWYKSLHAVYGGPWLRHAILLGCTLTLATFFVYQILGIGVFMVLIAVWWLWQQTSRPLATILLLRSAVVALVFCAAIYAVLSAATGFQPIASFLHAIGINATFLDVPLPAPPVIFNLYVFAVGLGLIAVPLILLQRELPITRMAILSVIILDLTGLFAGETDREWLFLAPIIAVPAGLALARIPWRWRLSLFAMQAWILVCIRANISFIEP